MKGREGRNCSFSLAFSGDTAYSPPRLQSRSEHRLQLRRWEPHAVPAPQCAAFRSALLGSGSTSRQKMPCCYPAAVSWGSFNPSQLLSKCWSRNQRGKLPKIDSCYCNEAGVRRMKGGGWNRVVPPREKGHGFLPIFIYFLNSRNTPQAVMVLPHYNKVRAQDTFPSLGNGELPLAWPMVIIL